MLNGNGSVNGAATDMATPDAAAILHAATRNSNGTAKLPPEMARALYAPLPPEALKPHPTKDYLSSVKAIFVIDRMNEVFGIDGWTYTTEVIEQNPAAQVPDDKKPGATKEKPGMIVVRVVLSVPAYGIRKEQFGGSDNADRGDAYKGAVTDAISKIASYLGIAMDVYKGGGPTKQNPRGMAVRPSAMAWPAQLSPNGTAAIPARPAPAEPPARVTPIAMPQPVVKMTEQIPDPSWEDTPAMETAVPAAAPKKLWDNRGQMKRAFGKLREQLGNTLYLRVLDEYSVTPQLNWTDATHALACFRELDLLAKTEVPHGPM